MDDHKKDFYQSLREKIDNYIKSEKAAKNKWADVLLLAPDIFYLLCKLTMDKDVSAKAKAKLGIAIVYFIMPIDLIPEAITGPLGYLDDIAIAAFALNGILNDTKPEVVKRHWVGDEDILSIIKHIIDVADEMVGSGLIKKLKGLLKDKSDSK